MARRLVGTNHVALTVTDLERSTEWYCRVLGVTVVSTDENVGPPYFTDVGYRGLFDLTTLSYVVALVQHPEVTDGFDPHRVGLDHLGFQVPDPADLPEWAAHLDEQGVPHSGIVHAPYADVINFRDPDGIALELSAINLDFWTKLVTQKASEQG